MEFQKLTQERRSIRSFSSNVTITEDEIKQIIACAQEAPSWKNSQTGRYYVVLGEDKVSEIAKKTLPEFNQNSSKNAAALVVTTFEANRAGFERDGSPTNEIGNEWGAYDLGLQNMLLCLKAKELGFDTLIMGIRDEKVLSEILGIPDSQHVVAVIALGKATDIAQRPKRKDVEEILKFY